jgi:CRP-like cAMP-binding protein
MNHLLASLSRKDGAALRRICHPHPLVVGVDLQQAGEALQHVYFPVDGYVSMVAQAHGTPGIEVGLVGFEGMLGAHVALGVTTVPTRALVQGEGMALRAELPEFLDRLAASPALQQRLHRYLYVRIEQLTGMAPCLRFHFIEARLARWLLMSHDRARGDVFQITQEFLSYMLGVRRAGVTRAAVALQERGMISYSRGTLTVLDRPALEATSCACYAADRASYRRLLGDPAG